MTDYIVIDCETNIKNRGEDSVGSNPANPHHDDNHSVYWGVQDGEHSTVFHVDITFCAKSSF